MSRPEQERDLERVAKMIEELDGEEFLLIGLEGSTVLTPEFEIAMASLRERRLALEEELAEVWAKTCSQC